MGGISLNITSHNIPYFLLHNIHYATKMKNMNVCKKSPSL